MKFRCSTCFILLSAIVWLAAGAAVPQAIQKPAVKTAPARTTVQNPLAEGAGISLVSFSAGALIAQRPAEYSGWPALNILDENPRTGWATPKGVVSPQVIVIALPEKTLLKTLFFDMGGTDGQNRGARDVLVEMSDTGMDSGFHKIAQVVLADKVNNQAFPVQAEVPGRWVRLTVQTNHGAGDYLELCDFRATGQQLTHTPVSNISGTYDTNYNQFHIRQEGTSLSGCYEFKEGVLTGGIEGRVLKFTWQQGTAKGPAIMVISQDGQDLQGLWWREGATSAPGGVWNGHKVSSNVGGCPHWAGGAAEQLARDLEESGRSRVYGINFDTDSAVIRDESRPLLDRIVAVLKANPTWNMTIEGHTDATGGAAHNQTLSEQRAQAVLAYLTGAGVAAGRLQAVGFGTGKPVADNTTELGRAQNRRVELVRR